MNRRSTLALLTLVSVVLLAAVTGCAQPPQAEIDSARAALEKAQAAEAQVYAPEALQAARDAQDALTAELEAQEGKFSLFRRYGTAKELAASAVAAAENASQQAVAGKEKARQEVAAMMTEVTTLMTEVEGLLASAPTGKGSTADIQVLKADFATIQTTVADAERAFQAERFEEARRALETARNTANSIKTTIEEAKMMKAGARRN